MLETNNERLNIKFLIAQDIENYANELSISSRELIKDIAKSTPVGLRTLERLLSKDFTREPYVKTVLEIYSFIYKTDSITELLTKVSEPVSNYIKKNDINFLLKSSAGELSFKSSSEEIITSDPIFNQIYIFVSRDYGTDLELLEDNFGKHGLRKVDEMASQGFLRINENNEVFRGKKLSWSYKTIANFSKTLAGDVLNTENFDLAEENYVTFFSGDVTREEAIEIKNIFKQAFRSALLIANNSKATESNRQIVNFSTVVAPSFLNLGDIQ